MLVVLLVLGPIQDHTGNGGQLGLVSSQIKLRLVNDKDVLLFLGWQLPPRVVTILLPSLLQNVDPPVLSKSVVAAVQDDHLQRIHARLLPLYTHRFLVLL